jgi:hypothetical protein
MRQPISAQINRMAREQDVAGSKAVTTLIEPEAEPHTTRIPVEALRSLTAANPR